MLITDDATERPTERDGLVADENGDGPIKEADGCCAGLARLNNRINPCYRPRNELTCSEVCADLRDDPLNSCVVVVVCLALVASAAIAIYWIVQAIK
mmetsp:Transcript_17744/g.54586  ORF Transcript_17744/g.54586 Transcript_17744/m.54586 type:complete len:97 (-) Transcript_17744:24-314(-)